MDAVNRVGVGGGVKQGGKVLVTTGAGVDVARVVHVSRVVAFRGVTLEHHALT